MIYREQYAPHYASAEQFDRFWSTHVDALDRHLSARRWALAAVPLVMIVYPIAKIAIPAVLHDVVPGIVRTVLHLI